MPNNIVIKSQSALMFVTPSGYSTGNLSTSVIEGIQSSSFSMSVDRRSSKQVGAKPFIINDPIRHPEATLQTNYLLNPLFINERRVGFDIPTGEPASYLFGSFDANLNRNIGYLIHPEPKDAFGIGSIDDFFGGDVLTLGNAFLTSYGMRMAVREIPTVSMGFQCSTLHMQKIADDLVPNPSINLISGNQTDVGSINLNSLSGTPTSYIVVPGDLHPTLQDFQIGGQKISGDHFLQSVQLDLSIPRVSSYGLGSDYVYGRPVQYPVLGTILLNSYVSGVQSGFLSGLLNNETGYYFDIGFSDSTSSYTGGFLVENAKLENLNYSLVTNNEMVMDASFSVEITPETGLKTYRSEVQYSIPFSGSVGLLAPPLGTLHVTATGQDFISAGRVTLDTANEWKDLGTGTGLGNVIHLEIEADPSVFQNELLTGESLGYIYASGSFEPIIGDITTATITHDGSASYITMKWATSES